jgi:hypothetical protein
MRWLIPLALEGDKMTYGHLKRRLEREANFSTIFSAHVGHVAGALMQRIQNIEPKAPLINVLVVNQGDGLPSDGAGEFMAKRFDIKQLAEKHAKEKYPDLWKETFDRAAAEVYRYSEADWIALYRRVFGKPLSASKVVKERKKRNEGSEEDGLQYNARRGGKGGEGPYHKALRLWVKRYPAKINRTFTDARGETEVDLLSGDRVDAVYYCDDRTVVLEVKSRISSEVDLRRGVYQCIKYRAVTKAIDVRENAPVDAYLVTEIDPETKVQTELRELPGEIRDLLRQHGIKHFNAPQKRKA